VHPNQWCPCDLFAVAQDGVHMSGLGASPRDDGHVGLGVQHFSRQSKGQVCCVYECVIVRCKHWVVHTAFTVRCSCAHWDEVKVQEGGGGLKDAPRGFDAVHHSRSRPARARRRGTQQPQTHIMHNAQ